MYLHCFPLSVDAHPSWPTTEFHPWIALEMVSKAYHYRRPALYNPCGQNTYKSMNRRDPVVDAAH